MKLLFETSKVLHHPTLPTRDRTRVPYPPVTPKQAAFLGKETEAKSQTRKLSLIKVFC